MIPYDHTFVTTNGVKLHVVQAGPEDGPLVILLHGFPDFWYGWHKQMDALAAHGYRVWAPDQRGYNISDKPAGIGAYNLNVLTADLIGLIDAAGCETAMVVGHDWGAGVAWWAACQHPERISKLVILNVPHHVVFEKTLRTNAGQRRRSWYFLFLQIPVIPEVLMGLLQKQFARGIQASANPGAFTDADLADYERAWAQPGARSGMFNWYRAIVQQRPSMPPDSIVKMPTRILWGKHDPYLIWEMAEASLAFCANGKLIFFEDATHWIQHDQPDRVNSVLLDFLKSDGSG